jgi:hypothetical protein
MRTITAFMLLFALMIASVLPAYGQTAICYRRAKGEKRRIVSPQPVAQTSTRSSETRARRQRAAKTDDYADFDKVKATVARGGGTNVEWRMKSETGNVGFEVYKETDQGRELVNDQIVPGSAARIMSESIYGTTYSIFDPSGTPGTTYTVIALGQAGQETPSEPSEPAAAGDGNEDATAGRPDAAVDPTASLLVSTVPKVKPTTRERLSSLTTQQDIAGQLGAKIAVRKEGLYRVALSDLQNAVPNLFTSANTANWRLFRDGVEQSAIIGFDPTTAPYIEFYGRGIDTAESDTHIYYLLVDPLQTGLRVGKTRGGRIDNAPLSQSYVATTSVKERDNYISTILNDRENWWGTLVNSSGQNAPTLTLSGVDPSASNATLTVTMQAWIPGSGIPTTQVKLNNTILGTITAPNYGVSYSGQLTVPTNLLQNGSNTLRLTALNGGFEVFDSYSLDYGRTYQAIQNSVAFTVPDQKSATVTGFTSPDLRAFLVGADDSLTQIGRLAIQGSGNAYSVSLPASSHPGLTKFFAIENSAILQAASVTANTPSHLSTTAPAADMIIISYSQPDFMAAANAWKNYRAGPNVNVMVVDVADIMDEFNYGALSAAAINDFLSYERILGKQQYVLLLGDASYDPRNYNGQPTGSGNLVPTKMVNTVEIETGSDDALADFDSDGLPEMAVGRIPARSVDYINNIFNKTKAFEATPALQDPNRGVLFAYDRYKGWDFHQTSVGLATQLDQSVPTVFVSHGYIPPHPLDAAGNEPVDPNSGANLIAAINAHDAYLVSYVGHGAQSAWADGGSFLQNSVVSQIHNPGLSIYTMLTCLNGYFIQPGSASDPQDSIAEVLMKNPNGGGPAAWASSGATTADVQEQMGLRFMEHINAGDIPRMGDLIRDAKSALQPGADVRYSWIYFGDPMLKVR